MIYKVNRMFWDENESTGYRHISIEYNDRVLMAVTSHNVSGLWESKVIPMGFSFTQTEIEEFSNLFSVLPSLMKFLCTETLSNDDIQKFLDNIEEI